MCANLSDNVIDPIDARDFFPVEKNKGGFPVENASYWRRQARILEESFSEPVAWGVFHEDGSAHIFQQKETAEVFGEPIPLFKKCKP